MIPGVAKPNRCPQRIVKSGRSAGNSTGWFLCRLLLLASWLIWPSPATAQVPPSITGAPTNQVLSWGGTVSLAVTAAGDAPLAYQWFKDSRLLLNQTNSTLAVTNASVTASGTYYVLVTNLSGMVISLPVSVAVGNPSLLAYGQNNNGQLGNGNYQSAVTNPIVVASNVIAGSAGGNHSLFVEMDGTLWGMGLNTSGQLGPNGPISNTNNPFIVATNVIAAAAGYAHSLFLTAAGTLWTMGDNSRGELGNGGSGSAPQSVASNVVAVAAGQYHSLFIKNDGTLWTMGLNGNGQLGNGKTSNTNLPINIASNVVAVAAGQAHSLFSKTDGTLWAMGYNFYGQLGNGTISDSHVPILVASKVEAVAAGQNHSLFITNGGVLWAMGANFEGQLGNGGYPSSIRTPVSVASNVVAVAAGLLHSSFITTDGTLWEMGEPLGNGTVTSGSLPSAVPAVAAGNVCAADQASHSLTLGTLRLPANLTLSNLTQPYTSSGISPTASTTPQGLTVNFTYNGSGTPPTSVGLYTVVGTIHDPNYYGSVTNTLCITWLISGPTNQAVALGATVTLNASVVAGVPLTFQWFKDKHFVLGATNSTLTIPNASVTDSGLYFVVVSNGNGMDISPPAAVTVDNPVLVSWGNNYFGQFGNGSTNNSTIPISLTGGTVTGAAGQGHSLFVTTNGILWAMGWNNDGQLGNGTTNDSLTRVSIASNVVAAAAGAFYSLFITTDGALWSMGSGQDGELCDGAVLTPFIYYVLTPKNVASGVVEVAAGVQDTLIIKRDGSLWGAGDCYFGQLGTNYLLSISTPILIATNVVMAAGGYGHSLFVTLDGTLWGLGNNSEGALGNGSTNKTYTPIIVASNVVTVAAGAQHSLFVTSDRRLWAMGNNQVGQLGNGSTNNVYVPVNVASNVVAVAAESYASLFVQADGSLWTMGLNRSGQLGDGTTVNSSTPVRVAHLSVANIFGGYTAQSLVVGSMQESATVALGNLNQLYTGSAINATASTTPPGLTVNLTYNGSALAPTNAGSCTVIGTISDPNYYGSATNTLVIGLPPQSFTASNTSGVNGPQLTLQLSGTPGYPYILQTATNLTPPVNWQSVFTNPADVNGNWSLTLSNLTALPGGFYRAVGQ